MSKTDLLREDVDEDNKDVEQIMISATTNIQAEAQRRRKYVYLALAVILTFLILIIIIVATKSSSHVPLVSDIAPIVVATWDKKQAADYAWVAMRQSKTSYKSLDGVVKGVQWCQSNCNTDPKTGIKNAFVDTEGKVTQSAMVIWGPTMETGSVANLYDIDDAVGVAKHVLIYTDHAMIVGEAATRFALQNGFKRKNLYNNTKAQLQYEQWITNNCSANYWRNVKNGDGCTLINGSYDRRFESDVHDVTGCDANETSEIQPTISETQEELSGGVVTGSVAIIAIDENGEMALATSSNGLNHKIAGRVSDAAIPGAGGYIDPSVGGCTATGDGDVIIRFTPSKTAVTLMKSGHTPTEAAQAAIDEIEDWCDGRQAVVLCLSKDGVPGIANNKAEGKKTYAYRSSKCDAAVSADVDNLRGTCV